MGASEPVAFVAELGGGIAPQMASSTAKGILRLGEGTGAAAKEVVRQQRTTEALDYLRDRAYRNLDAVGQRYSTVDVNNLITNLAENLTSGVATPPPGLQPALDKIYKRITAKGTVVGPRALNEMVRTFENEVASSGDKQLNLLAQRLRSEVDKFMGSPVASIAGQSASVTDLRPILSQTQKNYTDLQRMNAENIAATMQGKPPPHNINPVDLTNARAAYETASSGFQQSVNRLIQRDPNLKRAYDIFSGPNKEYQAAERAFNDVVGRQANLASDIQKVADDLGLAQGDIAAKTQEFTDIQTTLARSAEGQTYATANNNFKAADAALTSVTTQNTPQITELNTRIKALTSSLTKLTKKENIDARKAEIAGLTSQRNALQKAIDDAKAAKTNTEADLKAAEDALFKTADGQAAVAKRGELNAANQTFADLQARQKTLNNDLSVANVQYTAAVDNLNAKGPAYTQAKAAFDQALELAAPTPARGARPAIERVAQETQEQTRRRTQANEAAKRASRARNADQILEEVRIKTAAGVSVVDAMTQALTKLAGSDEFRNFFTPAQRKAVMDSMQGNWFANVGQRGSKIPIVGPMLGGPANTAAADRLNALVNFLKTGKPMKKPTLTTAAVRATAPSVAQAAAVNESEETRVARIDPVLRDQLNRMYAEAEKMWNEGRWGEANAMTERANALRKQMTENQSRRQPARAQ
jgi:hypothetical protein